MSATLEMFPGFGYGRPRASLESLRAKAVETEAALMEADARLDALADEAEINLNLYDWSGKRPAAGMMRCFRQARRVEVAEKRWHKAVAALWAAEAGRG